MAFPAYRRCHRFDQSKISHVHPTPRPNWRSFVNSKNHKRSFSKNHCVTKDSLGSSHSFRQSGSAKPDVCSLAAAKPKVASRAPAPVASGRKDVQRARAKLEEVGSSLVGKEVGKELDSKDATIGAKLALLRTEQEATIVAPNIATTSKKLLVARTLLGG